MIGFVIGTAGAIATIPLHLGPAWYPIAIAATALPCAWLGGRLQGRSNAELFRWTDFECLKIRVKHASRSSSIWIPRPTDGLSLKLLSLGASSSSAG